MSNTDGCADPPMPSAIGLHPSTVSASCSATIELLRRKRRRQENLGSLPLQNNWTRT
jgi:hypothetical protein